MDEYRLRHLCLAMSRGLDTDVACLLEEASPTADRLSSAMLQDVLYNGYVQCAMWHVVIVNGN